MKKYIDAEKLIDKINEHINLMRSDWTVFADGGICEAKDILNEITSLMQEQQKPNLENEIKDYTETLYHEIFGNGRGTLDEFDWEDIAQVIDDTARYFYNLNKNDV